MSKHLIQTESGLALVIDRPMLELTNISLETELEVTTHGDVIIVAPRRRLETGPRPSPG